MGWDGWVKAERDEQFNHITSGMKRLENEEIERRDDVNFEG